MPRLILGLETTCDETAAAVVSVESNGIARVHGHALRSQTGLHAPLGGVVPNLAARAHSDNLPWVIRQALEESRVAITALQAVSVCQGPGLIGGLVVGLSMAKGLSLSLNIPLLGVNHLIAHALSPRAWSSVPFPYLLLLMSGGHTQLVGVAGAEGTQMALLGQTRDDALGEAFDKIGRLVGLAYPAGPAMEQLAWEAREQNQPPVTLPQPMRGDPSADFSFSGIKSAAARWWSTVPDARKDTQRKALALGLHIAVGGILIDRIRRAWPRYQTWLRSRSPPSPDNAPCLVAAGGVAANRLLREILDHWCTANNWRLVCPPVEYCTDNAVMVAWAGLEQSRHDHHRSDPLTLPPLPRFPLAARYPTPPDPHS